MIAPPHGTHHRPICSCISPAWSSPKPNEQLYFALSRDGRHWRDLREAGFPVLTWKGGEGGRA